MCSSSICGNIVTFGRGYCYFSSSYKIIVTADSIGSSVAVNSNGNGDTALIIVTAASIATISATVAVTVKTIIIITGY